MISSFYETGLYYDKDGNMCLGYGVHNTHKFTTLPWDIFYNKLTKPVQTIDAEVGTAEWKRVKESCSYFIRGELINGKGRNDDNLGECCLLIIDGDEGNDGKKLSSIKAVHKAMKKFIHIVYTTSTPGRWRLVVLVPNYPKESSGALTQMLYDHLIKKGISVAFAGESKKKSQPMFYGQNTVGHKYKFKGTKNGKLFLKDVADAKKASASVVAVSGEISTHNRKAAWIEGLKSGTLHQVAVTYAGWKRKTTNLTVKQILDDMEVDVVEHCDADKVARWRNGERAGLEKWFKSNTESGYHKSELTRFVLGEDYLIDPHNGAPYLPLEVKMPEGSKFAKLVDSVLRLTEAVYNPDLAFYFSLQLIDYAAGGGYQSVESNKLDPLYIFAAGETGDGKTEVIDAAVEVFEQAMLYVPKHEQIKIFKNKKRLSAKGTGEGKEDDIMSYGDGADVWCLGDEFGLIDQGTNDKSARADRELVLSLRTKKRNSYIYPRSLASRSNSNKVPDPIKATHFNLGTVATEESLKGVIRDSDMGLGFIQRFVGGVARTPHWKTRRSVYGRLAGDEKVNKKVLKRLHRILVNQSGINSNARRYNSKCYAVTVEDAAIEYFDDLFEHIAETRDPRLNKFVQNVKPVCRAHAIYENPDAPHVTLEVARWASVVVNCSILYFDYLMGKLNATNRRPSTVIEERLIAYAEGTGKGLVLSKAAWMNKAKVSSGQNRYGREAYNPVWERLLADNIFVKQEDDGVSGKKVLFSYEGENC